MATAVAYLGAVFLGGLVARAVRLPPLIGFLAAGFVLKGAGVPYEPLIEVLANLGVTLLLFGIGLKLDVRQLLRREIWGTAVLHMAVTVALASALMALLAVFGIAFVAGEDWRTFTLLGFAISFSSTVLVVKILEERSESRSLYGRIAIGVLIIQDVAAVAFMTASASTAPSPWALALVLVVPLAWLLRRLWHWVGHGEMQVVFGVFVALVPGYALFQLVGIKGDLGALLMGILLAGHVNANELSRSLLSVKDLLLVAFFVEIGFSGPLTWEIAALGLFLVLFVPVQAAVYILLLRAFGLRPRTSVLSGLALGNHSEFALIIAAVGVEAGLLHSRWVVVLSVAVAASFVLASVLDAHRDRLLAVLASRIPEPPLERVPLDDRPVDLIDAEAIVLGMGRVGRAVYERLVDEHGLRVLGVESDSARVRALQERGIHVVEADATDTEFWNRVTRTESVDIAVLAMPFHGTNDEALRQLRASDFDGRIGAVARYDEDERALRRSGVNAVLHIYEGAGTALADLTMDEP
jgi:glutathione-regulated potassium-efflux system ancillary protein KefC